MGVDIDKGFKGDAHVEMATAKATKAASNIAKILPLTYGASESQRRVLATVAESIPLYAAPIWAQTALETSRSKIRNKNLLERTQRIMAIRITRCY